MKPQEYKNHRRVVPLYHLLIPLIILGVLAAALIDLQEAIAVGALFTSDVLIIALSFAMLLFFWYARRFATRVQDRAIRAEESLRCLVLTGQLPDPRLTIKQLTALRFASDEELIGLSKRAIDDKLSNDEIKKAVTKWRPDYDRV